MSGPRSAPPDLPGFTFSQGIGGGGFADVYLYQRHRPARKVAVKVLRREHLSAEMLRQFESEADVMAEVSAHPYIVTIFGMGVAPDGRPFIEMEYYPNPHFGLRAQGGSLPVAEVLRVGVQVGSAVQTAHQAGILHRDIKPANILTSSYGRPGLTDFGIASVTRDGAASAATGLSVAFAAPEVVTDQDTVSVGADVYGLSATIYTLLTGHSPFLLPGADNNLPSIINRVLRSEIPAIVRSDVPVSLQNVLRQGMAADPSHRPQSPLALARAFQDIERELHLSTTAIDVEEVSAPTGSVLPGQGYGPGGGGVSALVDDDDGTRAAAIQVVSPDGGPNPFWRGRVGDAGRPDDLHTLARPAVVAPVFGVKSAADSHTTSGGSRVSASASGSGGRARTAMVIAAAVGVFVVLALGTKLLVGRGQAPTTTTTTIFADPGDPGAGTNAATAPSAPTNVRVVFSDKSAAADGSRPLVISWEAKGARGGDTYRIRRTDVVGVDGRTIDAPSSPAEAFAAKPDERPCVTVTALRNGRASDRPSVEACLSGPGATATGSSTSLP